MLKYSIVAVALFAGSTFALADPNNGGPAGAMKGDAGPAMKGSEAAPSKNFGGGEMKSDRKASENFGEKSDRQAAGSEQKELKRDRQAEGNNQKLKESDRPDGNDRADSNERKNSEQALDKSRTEKGATGASEGTEGKARPKGSLTNISPEQKTRVRAAFSGHRVAPARDIGIAVNVGVVVPRSVHFYAVPEAIIAIVPDYSGYEYFMIDESHVAIVDPDTLEVVDIIVVA
ncbi:MAG: DUF1236 domain-containing protein [Hyphomicrobium sp.]|uniref:DUF1236 domain-containing protein n=1 Tax=Hyphomicrobium sp. TaxID=82 RepID=UPI0039E2D392